MAFKIGNQTVIHDADATSAIETNSNLDRLQINGTDVLIHDGSTITLKNVNINDLIESSINTDNVTEGTANLFYTTARQTAIENYSDQSELDAIATAANDATTKANAAETDAIATAKAYTDTRETVITTAYETYADTAEADAIAVAAADATSKAGVAQAVATVDAAADATTKASVAQAVATVDAATYTDTRETAITTAYESYANSGDTTTYNASKSYTDVEIATVLPLTGGTLTGALTLSGAPTSANHASTKAYVDSTISSGTGALDTDDIAEGSNLYYTDARVSSYLSTNNFSTQSYVDTAEADAIVSANTYTDTRETAITTAYQTYADQAETDAKAYTDTEVAAIVDGAPGTLDTLNELAAALGNDANLSTTLSTQIGTKVAKAGDTMTGALTLSGAPSSANHAATKAYVDSAITGGSLSNTDSLTEGSSNLYFTNSRVDARIPTALSSFTNDSGYITSFTDTNTTYTAGTGLNLVGTTFNNTAPDQTVSLTGSGATSISGTYPNFTISSTDTNTDTDTNTTYTAGNGLTLTGTEFTMSGSYTGNFTATGDVTAYSDARLKTNVTTIENALSKVQSMRGVMFDKVDSLSGETKQSTGVIAQETEKVLPEVVHNNDTGYKSVAYGNIVGVLIEAIKEQQEQIDKLTHDIEFLKGIRRN